MKKYFFIVLLFALPFAAISQKQDPDSIRIENLKKQLPKASATKRVNLLNEIAKEYTYLGTWGLDSVYKYGLELNKQATKLGFEEGRAYSLLYLGDYNVKKDFNLSEKMFKEALTIAHKIGKPDLLGWSYLAFSGLFTFKKDTSVKSSLKQAFKYFQQAKNNEGQFAAGQQLCFHFSTEGKYEEAFPYCETSLRLGQKNVIRNIWYGKLMAQLAFSAMAELYKAAGDYKTAMQYVKKGRDYSRRNKLEWDMANVMGYLFVEMGQPDSALLYITGNRPIDKISRGKAFLLKHENDKALQLFKEAADMNKDKPLNVSYKLSLLGMARAYTTKGNFNEALKYAKEGFTLAKQSNEWQPLLDSYDLLSTIYHSTGNTDSAYFYLKQYIGLKETVLNRQFLLKLYSYKKRAEDEKRTGQIKLLEKDNQIKAQLLQEQFLHQQQSEALLALLNKDHLLKDQQLQLKDQILKEQHFFRLQKEAALALLDKDNKLKDQQLKQQSFIQNALLAGLFLIIALAAFIIRLLNLKRKNEQLKNERTHAELLRQSAELEMQALRAQMNPHFIFNCLSSINRFILKNETKEASKYLTRFSRLMRMVLTNSKKSAITLEDELQMLRLYLEMERLRFKNSFSYSITFLDEIDADNVFIPPLLLQPFCENAIWHGLMQKDGEGKLEISLQLVDNTLKCIITDNGIGRQKAEELKTKTAEKQKSLGLKITRDRLSLLNESSDVNSFFRIEDITNENGGAAGTRVILHIKCNAVIPELVA